MARRTLAKPKRSGRVTRTRPHETEQEARNRRLEDKVRKATYRENRPQAFDLDVLLDRAERLRSDVFARELCRLALRYRGQGSTKSERPKIITFRDDFLQGEVMSEQEARRIFASRASYLLSPDRFRELGIPIAKHHCSHYEELPFKLSRDGIEHVWRLTITWGQHKVTDDVPHLQRLNDPSTHPIRRPEAWAYLWPEFMEALPGSLVARLLELSTEIARRYLMSGPDAALFILSGATPLALCIRATAERSEPFLTDHSQSRLILSIHPWLSARSVSRMYREFQRLALGRNNRPLTETRLALVDFAAPRWHSGVSWREIMDEWNAEHASQSYAPTAIRNFQRDVNATYKVLMGQELIRDRRRKASSRPDHHIEWTPDGAVLRTRPPEGKDTSSRKRTKRK